MMVGYTKKDDDISFGVDYMLPMRKKPCLIVRIGNCEMKMASFNNEQCARAFMDFMAEFMGVPKIDWNGDNVPLGLMTDMRGEK